MKDIKGVIIGIECFLLMGIVGGYERGSMNMLQYIISFALSIIITYVIVKKLDRLKIKKFKGVNKNVQCGQASHKVLHNKNGTRRVS